MSPKAKKNKSKAKNTRNENGATSPQFRQLMGLFETVQEHEEQHQQCVNDALVVYRQMSHDEFMETILFGIRKWMSVESFDNTYAQTGLRFLARLAVSNYTNDPENKIVKSILKYLLEHTSPKGVTRQFMCYFIYYLVRYANILKVPIETDEIVSHILIFVHDKLSAVREQAVNVLLLFQDQPDVIAALLEHLEQDSCTAVRRSIIKSIKFTDETVPFILERLQDTNELVRCELYNDLVERDVRSLTIEQRCQILNSAYNDQSARVQIVVADKLLSNWLRRYNNCYLSLLAAIKFDANEEDVHHFIRLSKYVLFNLFKKFTRDGHIERLCEQIGLKTDGEFIKCMPFDCLSLEMLVFWRLLIQFGRSDIEDQNSVEQIMSDIDTFCKYIQTFVSRIKPDRNWTQNGYKIQILIDILRELELDEYGRKSLSDFVANILLNETKLLNETAISGLVKCAEKSVNNDLLGQYFSDILQAICNEVESVDTKIDDLIETIANDDQKLLTTQLKSQILELKEEENSAIDKNDYARLREVRHEIKEHRMHIIDICRDFGTYDQEKEIDLSTCELSTEEIIKCLQIFFYSCHSIELTRAPPEMTLFYGNFVFQQLDAEDLNVRAWALKCNASFSLRFGCALFEGIDACYKQFLFNSDPKIWSIAITAICELTDKHQVDFQVPPLLPDENNETLASISDMLFDILTGIEHEEIKNSLIIGMCRLILSGVINDKEKIAFILVEFFNPNAFASSQQIIGEFVRKLCELKCQTRLISALVPAFELISTSRPQIKFKEIIKFLIAITIPELPHVTSIWHNQIAIELAKLMLHGYGSQVMSTISDHLAALQIDVNDEFKQQIRPLLAELLGKLTGQQKQSIKGIWKKIGFKDSDRHVAQPSPTLSASTSLNSMIFSDQSSPENVSAQNTTGTNRKRRFDTTRSSISTRNITIINDENAQQLTANKRNKSQRADSTGSARRAFGNRVNIL